MPNAFYESLFFKRRSVIKTMMIMNFTAILIFACVFQVSARVNSQSVTLNFKNAPFDKVLNEIRKQTGYTFIYTETTLREAKNVSMEVKNSTLQETLAICFASQPFTYKIINQTVVIQPKEKAYHSSINKINLPSPPMEIHGRVVNQQGEPLEKISILIIGTKVGTFTKNDGRFTLIAPNDKNIVLEVSSIGYQTKRVAVGSQTEINITMEEVNKGLEEVVIVGYGSLKRSELSGAQTTITSEAIERTVNTTIEQAIQGRAANVSVTQNSGQPGGGISINVRGVSSVNGNTEPLYVIDGVQIESSPGGEFGITSSINPLAGLNPSDIETLDILQGPSATSIYGSRGTNGVVLITTKRGKVGQTKTTYNFLYSLQDVPQFLPTLNLREYAQMLNEYKAITGGNLTPEMQNLSILGEGSNWQKALFRTAPLMKHQLSLSGGSGKTTFYLSGEFFDQTGVALGSEFKRYSFRSNLDHQSTKWLKISANINLSQVNEEVASSNESLINTAIEQSPSVPIKNANGSWGGPTGEGSQYGASNPIAKAALIDNRVRRVNVLGGFKAEVKILKGLQFRTSLNGNIEFANNYEFKPTYQLGSIINNTASSKKESSNKFNWVFNQLLQYNLRIDKHEIGLMASHEAQETINEGLMGGVQGFVNNTISELPLGDPQTATNKSFKNQWAMESYFGRLNYSYDRKYILQASIRSDGSPNFGPNKRWGTFPAASFAWRLSEENFLKDNKIINEFKIRIETGLTGNQGSGSGWYSPLSPYASPWGTGYLTSQYSNPNLQWESTKTNNIGFNLSIFKNRIELEGDFYIRKTDNLLMTIPLPTYMGTSGSGSISAPKVNIGALQNTGFGFTLNTVNVKKSDFLWKSNFNISGFKNELTELYSEDATIDRQMWFMDNFLARSVVGQPTWQWLGYIKEGVFQSVKEVQNSAIPTNNRIDPNGTWVGDIKYKDINNDGVIDDKDQTFIGQPWPKFTTGFTNSFTYKNFDLSVLITASYGNEIFNFLRFKNENPRRTTTSKGLLQGAREYAKLKEDPGGNVYLLNPGTTVPRITSSDANGNSLRITQDYVEDGSYLRLKNIQLGYNFSKAIISKLRVIQAAHVSFSVQNLATFTKYKGYDPEVGYYIGKDVDPSNSIIGIDNGRYPSTRMYAISFGVDF